jgi:predicted transcriptional regulator
MLSRKKRLSSEYTMLSILEYLYNNNSQKAPVSKFNIVTRTPGIKRQRPDRVNLMIDSLQSNGYILAVKTSNATFYKITEKGIIEYTKWIKNFLDFVRAAQADWFG